MADENIIIEIDEQGTAEAITALRNLDSYMEKTATVVSNLQTKLDSFNNKISELSNSLNKAASGIESGLNRALQVSVSAASESSSELSNLATTTDILVNSITIAEQVEKLFGATMGALPIGSTIAAIGLLVGAFVWLFSWLSGTNNQNEQLKESFTHVADGITSFNDGLKSAKSHLAEFDDTLFASSEEQQQLKNNMQAVQDGITSICKTATAERRDYTAEEIQALDEYFQRLGELNQQQLDIENSRMDAIVLQAEKQAERMDMSAQEYELYAQQWIKTAQEQGQNQIDLINAQCTTELELIRQRNTENGVLNQERYDQEVEAAIQNRDEQIALVNEKIGTVTAAYTEGYGTLTGLDELYYQKAGNNNMSLEEENQRHTDRLAEISAKYAEDSYCYKSRMKDEEDKHSSNMKNIWNGLSNSMSEEQKRQLGVWMGITTENELYGGKLDEQTRNTINNMIGTFEHLPKDTKDVMKDAMQPMLDEMNKKEPALFAKSVSIADGIVSRLKKSFDINSPSRKVRKIFKSVMEGAQMGLDDNTSSLLNQASSIADNVLDRFRNLDAFELVQRMQAEVYSSKAKIVDAFAARYGAASNNSVINNVTKQPIINFNQPVESPDTTARAVHRILTFGLAGDY